MSAKIFVDTNVLVYAIDRRDPSKKRVAAEWLAEIWRRRAGCVSAQVLNEFYSVITRQGKLALPLDAARSVVRTYFAWHVEPLDYELAFAAWALQDRTSLSWWDALIVAAAARAGASHLRSEDLNHGQNIDGVLVVDPFRASPQAVF